MATNQAPKPVGDALSGAVGVFQAITREKDMNRDFWKTKQGVMVAVFIAAVVILAALDAI